MGKLEQPCPSRYKLHIEAASQHANMGKTRGHGTRKGGASSGRARGGRGWRPANDAAASDDSGSESEEERVTKVKVKRDGESRLAREEPSAPLSNGFPACQTCSIKVTAKLTNSPSEIS